MARDPEKHRMSNSEYRSRHRDAIRLRGKAYYQRNREAVLAKNREWKENNRDKVLADRRRSMHSPRKIAYMKSWIAQNHEKFLEYGRRSRKKARLALRALVIRGYGGKCGCCGESREEFMTIDHIYGDGKEHRKSFKNTTQIMQFLVQQDFPKDRYRLLCMNCNWSRGLRGYCPHERENNGHSC